MNDKGCVVGIEINKTLYDFGKNNISKHHKKLIDSKNIELILGDAKKVMLKKLLINVYMWEFPLWSLLKYYLNNLQLEED